MIKPVGMNTVSFGKLPEMIVKVDGEETKDYIEVKQAASDLANVLIKKQEHENGKSIRMRMKKETGDYKIPKTAIDNSENPTVEFHVDGDKNYFATGKEAKALYSIGHWKWWANHDAADGRISNKEADDVIKQMDEHFEEMVKDPETKLKDDKKLVLYATRVPDENEFRKAITGKDTKVVLKDINFEA